MIGSETSVSPSPIQTVGNMGEGTSKAPWPLEQLNSFRMSSLMRLPDQATAVSLDVVPVPGSGKSPVSQNFFSPQVHYMQVCSNHVSQRSSGVLSADPRPLCTIPAGDILEGFVLPMSRMDAAKSYYSYQTSNALHHLVFSENPLLNQLSNTSIEVSTAEVNAPPPIASNMNTESASNFDKALFLAQHGEVSTRAIAPQSRTSTKGKSDKGRGNTVKTYSRKMVHSRDARAGAATYNKLRRARIAEGIKALQNIIPCSEQGKKESVLDDAINYIKFLKLQLKVLSQSRLNGEVTKYPFVYFEGYGHYLLDEHFCGEPLEEMMGQLIESNMQAALDLLGSKGLIISPMSLASSLLQTD